MMDLQDATVVILAALLVILVGYWVFLGLGLTDRRRLRRRLYRHVRLTFVELGKAVERIITWPATRATHKPAPKVYGAKFDTSFITPPRYEPVTWRDTNPVTGDAVVTTGFRRRQSDTELLYALMTEHQNADLKRGFATPIPSAALDALAEELLTATDEPPPRYT